MNTVSGEIASAILATGALVGTTVLVANVGGKVISDVVGQTMVDTLKEFRQNRPRLFPLGIVIKSEPRGPPLQAFLAQMKQRRGD